MIVVSSIDLDETYLTEPPRLFLVLNDTDGNTHQIIFETNSLRQLGSVLRSVQAQFPEMLADH